MHKTGTKAGISPLNPILYVWHERRLLTARITMKESSDLLGYTDEDMKFLIQERHLKPLGKKQGDEGTHHWKFSSSYIIELMEDTKWLDEAERILHKRISLKKPKKKQVNRAKSFDLTNN